MPLACRARSSSFGADMATPKTGNPEGRPPKEPHDDPDALAVGLAMFAMEQWGYSKHRAFGFAARCFLAGSREFILRPDAPGGALEVKFEMGVNPARHNPVNPDGRATTLKQKHAKWSKQQDKLIRLAAIQVMWHAYFAGPILNDPLEVCRFLNFAEQAGEKLFGEAIVRHTRRRREKAISDLT